MPLNKKNQTKPFIVNYLVWSSRLDYAIGLYLKISKNFMGFIFNDIPVRTYNIWQLSQTLVS